MAAIYYLFLQKSSIIDVRLGSKYTSVKITSHLTYFRETSFVKFLKWIFFKFYLKKNKFLSVSVKDKSCNSPEGLKLY